MNHEAHHRFGSRPFAIVWGTVAIVVGFIVAFEFRFIVLATLIGVGIGVLTAPLITYLQSRLRIPRNVSGLVVATILIGGVVAIGYALYVIAAGQGQRLVEQWPKIVSGLVERLEAFEARFPWAQQIANGMDVSAALQRIGSMFVRGVATGLSAISGIVVIVFVGVFTAVNAGSYFRGFLTLFPRHRRARIAVLGRGAADVLRRWFFSHLIVTTLSGVVVAIAFWILGVEYWLLFGVVTAVLDFIPYIGAILTGAAACIVTLGTQPEKVWWVLGIYFLVQELEADISLPLILKGRIQLPEAHLLVFMLLMAVGFGFVGMLVAAPLFAVLHYWYRQAYVPWTDAMVQPAPVPVAHRRADVENPVA